MASNGGSDRVTNAQLYESQSEQDDRTQRKLDRLEEKIDARPTSKMVLGLLTLAVTANQAATRFDGFPDPVQSAMAFLGF
jgi:hypothetical protein